ncbi:sigma-54 dependent transcriptional regulator [Paracoccaceae bacterium]|jgi:two-component system response regulator FlrC|nr:sigma-54 dependent transcriptional regulator [Paracoccaceae bacterium]OAH09038.1 Transcriptional regulatory protein QseF [Rhodobacteraceae bacterium SB2]MDB4592249.1 sigma-54 dependent transcriptional regulator [Paracoccaceae bacterium]MDC0867886.1 sigma-54 dependent transcriptional regulator [Paracoccaceae bacterium]MDG1018920.1 sigma-54 dependent transcriptional regulator [Paracoccaceae bacterium]|tara:strand:+ start:2190 stop:3344 length:1155 start_codon:yes stop_codon:yes gene_type:complete
MLYSLHVSDFKFAGKLSQILQNYQCSIVEHSEVKETWDAQGQKVKAILSAAFEQKLGGLKAVVEMVKKRGAKSIVIVDEAAEAFRVERSMNGALLRVSMPIVSDDMAQSFIFALVASFITDGDSTIAADPVSVDLLKLGDRVARAQVNVFVNGPTGSGKEVLAQYIHKKSSRAEKPFVAINCAAIPENMLEALLFGHKKGAFTGASTSSDGIFQAADGGTLLLDEVSEMSMPLQAKLLRVLQERSVVPLGASAPIPVDVRTLATSNRNIPMEIRRGRFREDLYFRLNVFPLATKALNERLQDIIPIAAELLVRHQSDLENFPTISGPALQRLLEYSWPGNVRELENVIQRATVLRNSNIIEFEDIMIDTPSPEYHLDEPLVSHV